MARLALIQNDIVVNIIEGLLVDFPEYMDVNDRKCGKGYTYDDGSGTFTENATTVFRITLITKRSFMQRFTQPERIAIRKSADDIVIDIHEDLKIASNVDLELVAIRSSLDYFVSVGILETSRVDEILVEGTEAEAY